MNLKDPPQPKPTQCHDFSVEGYRWNAWVSTIRDRGALTEMDTLERADLKGDDAQWGAVVRFRDGRVRRIEKDAEHPISDRLLAAVSDILP